jgi:hypothetical protein
MTAEPVHTTAAEMRWRMRARIPMRENIMAIEETHRRSDTDAT